MEINDNKETVTCRICGEQCKRIYGKHLKFKHNNMTTDEYKKIYPGAPIMALLDKVKTSTNSGKHMKDEKYKKMFSDMFKGEKNPNHKSNTTELERKSRSPFSKDFVKYDGIENVEEHISNFAKLAIKDRISDTTIQYYLDLAKQNKDIEVVGFGQSPIFKMANKYRYEILIRSNNINALLNALHSIQSPNVSIDMDTIY